MIFNRKLKITDILTKNFNIYKCTITDVSKEHEGHSGFIENGQKHIFK